MSESKTRAVVSGPSSLLLARPDILPRLIEREKRVIVELKRMKAATGRLSSWVPSHFSTTIQQAEQRLKAFEAGLYPIRIGGVAYSTAILAQEGQHIPAEVLQKEEEVRERFPTSRTRVYGWDRNALPQQRRERDPILVMEYGGRAFLLGFFLEVHTGDEELPEFVGFTARLSEPRGRGRPRKVR